MFGWLVPSSRRRKPVTRPPLCLRAEGLEERIHPSAGVLPSFWHVPAVVGATGTATLMWAPDSSGAQQFDDRLPPVGDQISISGVIGSPVANPPPTAEDASNPPASLGGPFAINVPVVSSLGSISFPSDSGFSPTLVFPGLPLLPVRRRTLVFPMMSALTEALSLNGIVRINNPIESIPRLPAEADSLSAGPVIVPRQAHPPRAESGKSITSPVAVIRSAVSVAVAASLPLTESVVATLSSTLPPNHNAGVVSYPQVMELLPAGHQAVAGPEPGARLADPSGLPLPVWVDELVTDLARQHLSGLEPLGDLFAPGGLLESMTEGWLSRADLAYELMGAAVLVVCYHEVGRPGGILRRLVAPVPRPRGSEAS